MCQVVWRHVSRGLGCIGLPEEFECRIILALCVGDVCEVERGGIAVFGLVTQGHHQCLCAVIVAKLEIAICRAIVVFVMPFGGESGCIDASVKLEGFGIIVLELNIGYAHHHVLAHQRGRIRVEELL